MPVLPPAGGGAFVTTAAIDRRDALAAHTAFRFNPETYMRRRWGFVDWQEAEEKKLPNPRWHEGMSKMCRAFALGMATGQPVVIGSAHAQSKDYLAGRLAFSFAEVFVPSITLLTAPTDRQVKKIMWAEFMQAFSSRRGTDDGLPKPFKTKFEISDNHYILPFTTKETGEAVGKFQGFHAPYVCVVFSEAQAIPDEVFDQVEGVLTGEVNLFVCLGNPTRATGRFASMLKNPGKNIVVNLNALDSPNYTERRVVVPGMARYEWVEDKRAKWGEDDPRWYGRVLGLVPPMGLWSVFPDNYYQLAQKRTIHRTKDIIVVACDPAGGGEDDCEIIGMRNFKVVAHKTMSGTVLQESPEKVATEMFVMKQDIGANTYIHDKGGLGHFLGPLLKRIDTDPEVVFFEHDGAEAAKPTEGEEKFQNERAATHFIARDVLISGECTMPPDDDGGWGDQLREEMTAIEYFENKRTDRIQIEDKDDLRERLGHSPNKSDAWILAVVASKKAKPIQDTKKAKKPSRWDDEEEPRSFMAS